MHDRPMVPSNRSLPGQESLYNLTFDELHDQLGNVGKPLNATDSDELRNVISVVENIQQIMQNPPSSSSSSSSASLLLRNFNSNDQASSKKTVDHVRNETADQEHVNGLNNQLIRQQLGETTLEEFLVHAGVINLGNQNGVISHQPITEVNPMVDLLHFPIAVVQPQQYLPALDSDFHISEAVYENSVAEARYSDNQLPVISMPALSATSAESQAAVEKKQRCTDEMMEKTIERRQKRMIKNRESAARSRERKQAYTTQLEHAVFHSRKTNNWLKKQKEVEIVLSSDLTPMPRYQLRRTSSASF